MGLNTEFHRIQEEEGWTSSRVRKLFYFVDHFLSLNTYIPYSTTRFKESLDIPIILTMTAPKQLKQRYYYIFWSIATVSVVIGQIYVATGYRSLAQALRMSLS